MSNVGRNEPCPCGSGKKFKRCHLLVEAASQTDSQRAMRMHDLDRELVVRLLKFASERLGKHWIDDLLDFLDIEELDEPASQLVVPCGLYEWVTEDGVVVERFLESGPKLAERERGWLEAQTHAWLSIWEVQSVTPGISVSLRDLFTGEERVVLEKSASRTLLPRDAVLARVVDFEGLSVFCGVHSRTLPPRPAATVVDTLRKELRCRSKAVSVERLRKGIPLDAWIITWEDAIAESDYRRSIPPKLQNTDGDPLLLTKDRYAFESADRARIEARLAELGEPEEDYVGFRTDHVFVVQRPGNAMHKSWDNTIVGRIAVHERELIVETNSIRRADDLRAKIDASLDSMLRHRTREHEDPEVMMRATPKTRPSPLQRDVAPPEVLDALRDMKRRTYEDWLDTPIPALAGSTPREAAKKRGERKQLVVLLREIENHESRVPPAERVDLSMLWTQLGLRDAAT